MKTTLNKVIEVLPYFLSNKIVPFIHGSPSLGKSYAVKALADKLKLQFIDIRLSQMESVDLLGMPDVSGNRSSYKPFDVFPLEHDEIPTGKKGWLIILK